MRHLSFVLGLLAALATGEERATEPLPLQGDAVAQVTGALMRLSAGDTAPLEALPIDCFLRPPARPTGDDPDLTRAWTADLPAALARLDPGARTRALTRLDAVYRTHAAASGTGDRPRLAAALLPAPSAVAELTRAADLAFDHGRFADYLGMAALLAQADHAPIQDRRRADVATLLSGRGPQIDAGLRLAEPGLPQISAATAQADDTRLAVAWTAVPGWVLAADPWGRVRWQYRVDRRAIVTAGPGAALVSDSRGLRALLDDGSIHPLPPLPLGAQMLAVAGGAAWFATGPRAWRLDLADGGLLPIDLGDTPLAAPLVRGRQSLWLLAQELVLVEDGRPFHRLRHGLPAIAGWRLAADRSQPLVLSPEGRAWRLEALAEQLPRLDAVARARLLLRAERPQDALTALGDDATPAGRNVALSAHVALGLPHVAAADTTLDQLAVTAQDRVRLAAARLLAAGRDPFTQADATLTAEAVSGGDLLLTGDAADLARDPAEWAHACSLAAWRDRGQPPSPAIDLMQPCVDTAEATTLPDETQATAPDGGVLYRTLRYRLFRELDQAVLTCHDAAGTVRWRHRWRAPSFLSAPSLGLDLHQGVAVVNEGGSHLRCLAGDTGRLLGVFATGRSEVTASQLVLVSAGRLAFLAPLGIADHLVLLSRDGSEEFIPLASPGRWLLPVSDQVVVLGLDGVARILPGAKVCPLPPMLTTSPLPPAVQADGLVLDGRLWRWRR